MAADSGVRRRLRMTRNQALHKRLMWAGLECVRSTYATMKGGTAFAFALGLNRHSTDLDCDAEQPVERRDRIGSVAQAIG